MLLEKQEHLLKKGKPVVVITENGLDAGSAGVELLKLGIEEVYLLKVRSYFLAKKKASH